MSQSAISTIPTRAIFMRSRAAIFEKLNLSMVSLSIITNRKSILDDTVMNKPKYPTSLRGNMENDVRLLSARFQSFL